MTTNYSIKSQLSNELEPPLTENVINKDAFVCQFEATAGNIHTSSLNCLRSALCSEHSSSIFSSDKHISDLHLAPLGPGQFLVRVTVNGEKLCILYDSGASLCFARPGLSMLSDPNVCSDSTDESLKSGGLQIRLGDDSLATTGGCKLLKYIIGKHKHDWDYHVMDLPRGIDLIIGMDFMKYHDVSLLCGPEKVLFGTELLSFMGIDMTDMAGPYGSLQFLLDQLAVQQSNPSKVHKVASQTNDKKTDPASPYGCFSMKSDDNRDDFDADLCTDPERFDKLSALCATTKCPMKLYREYVRISLASESVSAEQKAQLTTELEEFESDHSSKYDKRSRPDDDDESVGVSTEASANDSEIDGEGSFLCVMKKQGEHSLNALRAAQDLADVFPSQEGSDQYKRTEKVRSRLSALSEEKMKKKADDAYAEFSRAWVKAGTVDPTEENVQKWKDEAYPKDSDGKSIADQIDTTIPGEEEWVKMFLAGEIDKLAGEAFNPHTTFDPPPWAESLRLYLDTTKGLAKNGPRIRCPVHLREELKQFHELLYSRGFIEPATDCDCYASVLIVRKPDNADGTPRGYRFVVDLRARNATLVNIANQLPEAATLFELLKDAKCINVFDVRDGYWNCPLFYDNTDPESERNNSRRLCAFQSECGEWMFKCLPQGLSVSGPYFQAWLTRIFRKYDVVMNQTIYVPKDKEEQRIKTVDNMIAAAKHIQAVSKKDDVSHNQSRGPGTACLHDPDAAVDSMCAAAQSEHNLLSGRKSIKPRLRKLNNLIAAGYKPFSNKHSSHGSIYVDGVLQYPTPADADLSLLVFVDGKIQVKEIKESPPCCSSLSALEGCLQRNLDNIEPEKIVQLHVCENGSAIYADAQALAAMNAAIPVTDSIHNWAAEILVSSRPYLSALCKDESFDKSARMKGGLSEDELKLKNRDSRLPGDLGVWTGEPFLALYLDDGITRSLSGVREAKLQATIVSRICAIERIPLNQKVKLLCKYVRFLGMINGNGLVIPCPEKVTAIAYLTRPSNVKELQSFLGAVNWFRRHVENHAKIQVPLNNLTKKGVEWNWTDEHEQSWLALKRALMSFPVLRTFDSTLPTILFTDSSALHVGANLCQELPDGTLVSIAYHSRSLRGPELSYPIQHKEALAIVSGCMAFVHYLLASHFTVRTCSDHRSLESCFKGMSKVACDRVTRWVQKLSMFNMTVFYLPGVQMDFPDLLSRCKSMPKDAWVENDLIDSQDFQYNPLLSLVPEYLSLMNHFYGNPTNVNPDLMDFSCSAIQYDERDDDPETTWTPHEKALMMPMWVLPQTSSEFCETDYMVCKDFGNLYLKLRIIENPGKKKALEEMLSDARTMVKARYDKLKVKFVDPVFPLTKIAKSAVTCHLDRYFIEGDLLYYLNHRHGAVLCVPDVYDESGMNHRKRIFDEAHGTHYRGHRGRTATENAIRARFFWPNWCVDVKIMLKACESCQVSKIDRQKPQGLMNPVAQPLNIAQHYNIDFIGPLPRSSNGNHCMMIVVDRFSRRVFLYATSKYATSEDVGNLIVDELFMREGRGIPSVIISDNDKLFTANFWRTIFARFGTKLNFTHGARSQHSNGLAERMVAVVEEILRTRINYKQDDWEELIPALLFVINTMEKSTLLGKSPMQIELGFQPRVPFDMITEISRHKFNQKISIEKPAKPESAAKSRISEITAMRESIAEHFVEVQAEQKKYHDERTRTTDALIKPGAKAYVSMPIKQMIGQGLRPSQKLAHQRIGPLKVLRRVGANAFELDLGNSVSSQAIPVFHVKYLSAAPNGRYVSADQALLPGPVYGNADSADAEYELRRIVDRRTKYKKFEYFVEYKGYPLARDYEWRSELELTETAPAMLAEFTEMYDCVE